jgi:hypothetical protein
MVLLLGAGMVSAVVIARLEPGAARSAASLDGDDAGSSTSPASWVGSYHVRSVPVFRPRRGHGGARSRAAQRP